MSQTSNGSAVRWTDTRFCEQKTIEQFDAITISKATMGNHRVVALTRHTP